jgi:hypothetical protein
MKGLRRFALSCCLVASSGAVSATEIIERQRPSFLPLGLAIAAVNESDVFGSAAHYVFALSASGSAHPAFSKEAI